MAVALLVPRRDRHLGSVGLPHIQWVFVSAQKFKAGGHIVMSVYGWSCRGTLYWTLGDLSRSMRVMRRRWSALFLDDGRWVHRGLNPVAVHHAVARAWVQLNCWAVWHILDLRVDQVIWTLASSELYLVSDILIALLYLIHYLDWMRLLGLQIPRLRRQRIEGTLLRRKRVSGGWLNPISLSAGNVLITISVWGCYVVDVAGVLVATVMIACLVVTIGIWILLNLHMGSILRITDKAGSHRLVWTRPLPVTLKVWLGWCFLLKVPVREEMCHVGDVVWIALR